MEFHEKIKMWFTICKYLHLVPAIFKSEKCVKYACTKEMTDDIMHSTQYQVYFLNRAILANLQHRPLKLGTLIVLQEIHLWATKLKFPWLLTLFQSRPT